MNGAAGPRSILIVRLSAIGDVVHAMPLACRLRRGFPGARISWAVGRGAEPLLRGHPAVDEILLLEKRAPVEFVRNCIAARARRADVAIDLQGLFVSAAAALLSGARRRLSFDWARTHELASFLSTERLAPARDGGRETSITLQYLAFADALGAPPAPIEFRLAASEEARAKAEALLGGGAGGGGRPRGPFAALIVGAGKPANAAPPETLEAAARILSRAGLEPVLVGGARDARAARAIAAATGARDLVGRSDLATTLALLERAAVAIGGDTGPLNMAGALGTPVVGVYGGSDPRRTGPIGGPARLLWRRWSCAPCQRRRCPIDRGCLAAIPAEEVAGAALSICRNGG